MNAPRLLDTVGRLPGVGSTIRWCARLYEENSIVTIRHGLAAGYRWRRHHRYVNGYWVGHYEREMQEALARELKPNGVFLDIGAHAGFFTLVAARLVGPGGRCVAIEAWPENDASIREQMLLNELPHCLILNVAIADRAGRAAFSCGATTAAGHLGRARGDEREVVVDAVTIDHVNARVGPADVIKLDVEGAEVRALCGATETLRTTRPVLLIELHGPRCESEVKALLLEAHYAFFDLGGRPLEPASTLPTHVLARPQPMERPSESYVATSAKDIHEPALI